MALLAENFLPYILAAIAGFAWYYFGLTLPSDADVLGPSLTLGAILTGFLSTSKAILMALDSPVMRRLRETTYIEELVSYLAQGIWLNLLFCFICLAGFFPKLTGAIYGIVWASVMTAAAASFIRVTRIMLKILKHPETVSRQ